MKNKNIDLKVLKILLGVVSFCMLVFITFIVIRQPVKPLSNSKSNIYPHILCPLFAVKENRSDEKKIARHFAVDTLPGLMRKGLIQKFRRNASGTYIFVKGNLWKYRSTYFKQSLLTEVFVYNKVNGYELSTQIIDSTSKKLYAQISSSAKMDFYD